MLQINEYDDGLFRTAAISWIETATIYKHSTKMSNKVQKTLDN